MTVKLNVIAIATSAAWLVAPPATRSLAAQPNSAVDPVITHMRALGLDSSRTRELAQALFDSLGPRLTGSPDIARAQNWLLQQYRSWGIDARNEPYGTWRGWRRGYSHIDLIEPRVRSLDGVMVAFSPGTNGKVLSAGTIILPRFHDSTAFVQWLPAARGKLVLASAPRSSCRPSDDWARNATPASKARNDSARAELAREWGGRDVRGSGYSLALGGGELGLRLEAGGAAGLITSRPKDSRGAREIFETYNVRTPTISLGCEDYGLVFRLTEANQQPRLRLDLDAELLGERPVFNTIATIRGTEKPDEYVLLSAHFDSWDGGSGATDNGTGTLTVLEAMRILRRAYPKPRRTIVVGHWSGEEVGLVGSRAFSEDHPEIIRGLHALFNQDNGTGRIQSMNGGGLAATAGLVPRWLSKVPEAFRNQITFSVGAPSAGGSDGASFACYGAPAYGLGAASWDYGSYTWHTERDTYDKVVFDELNGNATIMAMLGYLASEDPELLSRERVDLARSWPVCAKAPRSTNPRLK